MKDNDKKNNGIIITSYARWGSRNICHFSGSAKKTQKNNNTESN